MEHRRQSDPSLRLTSGVNHVSAGGLAPALIIEKPKPPEPKNIMKIFNLALLVASLFVAVQKTEAVMYPEVESRTKDRQQDVLPPIRRTPKPTNPPPHIPTPVPIQTDPIPWRLLLPYPQSVLTNYVPSRRSLVNGIIEWYNIGRGQGMNIIFCS